MFCLPEFRSDVLPNAGAFAHTGGELGRNYGGILGASLATSLAQLLVEQADSAGLVCT